MKKAGFGHESARGRARKGPVEEKDPYREESANTASDLCDGEDLNLSAVGVHGQESRGRRHDAVRQDEDRKAGEALKRANLVL